MSSNKGNGDCNLFSLLIKSVIIEYDRETWTAGWRHFMDGFTVYYSKSNEINIEGRSSFQATTQTITMVELKSINVAQVSFGREKPTFEAEILAE